MSYRIIKHVMFGLSTRVNASHLVMTTRETLITVEIRNEALHEKTDLMFFVVIIPKDRHPYLNSLRVTVLVRDSMEKRGLFGSTYV